jgi:predicted DsbA family dithiol-disulfide isomerase
MTSKTLILSAFLAALLVALPACAQNAESSSEPAAAAETGEETIVARVGEAVITEAELHEAAAAQLAALRQQEFEILTQTLSQLVAERLLEAEAASRGIDLDTLIVQEVESKIQPPTDEQVDAFYEQNKARINQPKEQVAGQIRQMLGQQQGQQIMSELLASLSEKAEVELLLEEPRVEVAAGDGPPRGPEDAPVTIVEFSDFQCPYCARVNPTLDEVLKRYPDQVRVVFRHFPLEFHKEAPKAAEASRCASEQGKFWEYHDLLFANQKALGVDQLKQYAAQLGLDQADFDQCLDSGREAAAVQQDMADGRAAGVSGTPAFFINGRFVNGALPVEAFVEAIEAELADLGIESPIASASAQ